MKCAALVLGLLLLAPGVASAKDAQRGWRREPLQGGCAAMFEFATPAEMTVSWDGACIPGKLISGPGALRVDLKNAPAQAVFRTITLQATFVSGVPDGRGRITMINPAGQSTELQMFYRMGCAIEDDGELEADCTPYAP